MTKSEPPTLRLVYDRTNSIAESSSPLRLQYLLPIAIPNNAVLVDVRTFQFHHLEKAVGIVTPKWIFDFRRNARFDALVGGRSHAFSIFHRYNAKYIDIQALVPRGLPFLEKKRSSLWFRVFRSVFRRARNIDGPILILSDDVSQFLDLSPAVLQGLNRATRNKFGLSFLSTSMLQVTDANLRDVM